MALKIKAYKEAGLFAAIAAAAFFIALVAIPRLFSVSYSTTLNEAEAQAAFDTATVTPQVAAASSTVPAAAHITTPQAVKGIYMSACVASAPDFRESLEKLIDTTELNAVVLDIKDFSGTISYPLTDALAAKYPKLAEVHGTGCVAKDMQSLISELHSKGIYVIGRITTFQDPYYTKLHPELAIKSKSDSSGTVLWKDTKGLSYIDPGATPYWEYAKELAEASHDIGFDEIQFDYIRYPADGRLSDADFSWSVDKGDSKPQALTKFFSFLDDNLHADNITISADLFGMTTTAQDDMGIGQVLENALQHFDYVSPMVYPSHYPTGFNGWKDVNAPTVVGPLIKFVMTSAVARDIALKKEIASTSPSDPALSRINPLQIRPWLQDEDYPVTYTPDMVRAQIHGAYDAGLTSWLLWSASNKYTSSALEPDNRPPGL